MFAFNSDDWSLNPAEVYLKFFFKKCGLKRTKRGRGWSNFKTWSNPDRIFLIFVPDTINSF